MSGAKSSEGGADFKSISSTASTLGSGVARVTETCERPRVHLQVIDGKSRKKPGSVKAELTAEQVNQCMLLLLVLCLAIAGSIVGAVRYLGAE